MSKIWLLLTLVAASLLPAPAWAAEAPGPGSWLNVQECGASGSGFETTASATAGSREITVADPGDFRAGQAVMVSRAAPRYTKALLWGPDSPYASVKPLGDWLETRGYDGSTGSWTVFLLEIDGANPLTFRWSDDLARTWKGTRVPVSYDWQKLSGGTEVRFARRDWQPGHLATFHARDQLLTTIEKVEGKVLTLRDPATQSAKDAVVRHRDDRALQAAIERALKEKRHLFLPPGHYRLAVGLSVKNPEGIRIEGSDGVNALLDISDGEGGCISLYGGTEATVRNLRLVGHTGMAQAAGSFTTSSGNGFWACALKGCSGVTLSGTERVLVENVHASRMASECFYSQGPGRAGTEMHQDAAPGTASRITEPKQYTRQTTYLRCSVTDCAANAFNNNDVSENTSVLYCRVNGAGWHAYEGPARFIRLIGNYVRNAGPFTIGDMSHRHDWLHDLGCGQAVVSDNVFESVGDERSQGIAVNHGATQVVISNNLFINYNGPAIDASSFTVRTSYPSNTITIAGNVIDMTGTGVKPAARTGIRVSASNVIVSNNQVYVRGDADPRVTGILVSEPAVNVNVHDNLVRGCGAGIRTGRAGSRVTQVVDGTTFLENGLPLEWRVGHRYRGWNLAWLTGGKANTLSTLDDFDPATLRFKLAAAHPMKAGDRFEVFAPSANWQIHHNTVAGCLNPVVLDSYGSATSAFRENSVSRGATPGVKRAIEVRGLFKVTGNQVSGFDEPGSVALALFPDGIGRACRGIYRDNVIQQCSEGIAEGRKGLWEAATASGNLFLGCGSAPKQSESAGATPVRPVLIAAEARPMTVLSAPKPPARLAVDGDVAEWPWKMAGRALPLAEYADGARVAAPTAFACAASDAAHLYVALRVAVPKGAKVKPSAEWGPGDGVEVSFQFLSAKDASPIFLMWGTVDGHFTVGPHGGATPAQANALQRSITYAARTGPQGWTCEWKIPLAAVGARRASIRKVPFNIGVHHSFDDSWHALAATGGSLYQVGNAGELVLGK